MKLPGWAVPARCVLVLVWLLLWRLSQADHPIVTISRQHKGDMFAAEGMGPSYLLKIHTSLRTTSFGIYFLFMISFIFPPIISTFINLFILSSFHPFVYFYCFIYSLLSFQEKHGYKLEYGNYEGLEQQIRNNFLRGGGRRG